VAVNIIIEAVVIAVVRSTVKVVAVDRSEVVAVAAAIYIYSIYNIYLI
jgi:hypothetical protein